MVYCGRRGAQALVYKTVPARLESADAGRTESQYTETSGSDQGSVDTFAATAATPEKPEISEKGNDEVEEEAQPVKKKSKKGWLAWRSKKTGDKDKRRTQSQAKGLSQSQFEEHKQDL